MRFSVSPTTTSASTRTPGTLTPQPISTTTSRAEASDATAISMASSHASYRASAAAFPTHFSSSPKVLSRGHPMYGRAGAPHAEQSKLAGAVGVDVDAVGVDVGVDVDVDV